MAGLALKYRPHNFEDLVGQLSAATSLKNAIKHNELGHAYLFHGSRGVGKTSTARILAKCLNCQTNGPSIETCETCDNCREITAGNNIDVIEMDAASNRGIDHIRELRENVRFSPMKSKYKIYIIDEVNMLTTESFNALLKTLEEPPAHAVFIMATTEIHKIPETILSRCQAFTFKKFSIKEIKDRLAEILKKEEIAFEEEALFMLAQRAEGSMRDSISLLDQVIAFAAREKVSAADVAKVLGLAPLSTYLAFLEAFRLREVKQAITTLHELSSAGYNLKQFLWDFLNFLKDATLVKQKITNLESMLSSSQVEQIKSAVLQWDTSELSMVFEKLYHLYSNWSLFQSSKSSEILVSLEIAVIDLFRRLNEPSVSKLMQKITLLSEAIQKGESFTDTDVKQPEKKAGTTPPVSNDDEEDAETLIRKEFIAQDEKSPLDKDIFSDN